MNSCLADTCSFDIPEELILEILVRLPAKTLVRFKTVCKRWKTLITDPSFAITQFQLCKKLRRVTSHLLLQYSSVFALDLDVDDLLSNPTEEKLFIRKFVPLYSKPFHMYNQDYYTIMGTCNGIICFRLTTEMKFCLWNPTVNETRFVSYPDYDRFNFKYTGVLFSGFGYAPSIDDFKIVLMASWTQTGTTVYVYSLCRDSWSKTICCNPDITLSLRSKYFAQAQRCLEETVLNDALLFVRSYRRLTKLKIVKFDMVNECFEKVADLQEVRDTRMRKLLRTEIGVINDNKIVVYYVFRETSDTLQLGATVMRNVVEARVLLDQHGCFNTWKMMYEYKGDWEVVTEDVFNRDLIRITGDGKVLMFADCHSLGKWQIVDITQNEPSLVHINVEHSHQTKYKAKYVPSLISPNSF